MILNEPLIDFQMLDQFFDSFGVFRPLGRQVEDKRGGAEKEEMRERPSGAKMMVSL